MIALQANGRGKSRYERAHDLLTQWRLIARPSVGLRVLVVGCEPALVRYFCTFVKICGYRKVGKAPSATIAFDKAQADPPDILIVMMMMPDISGAEIGLLISHESGCRVLFVTAAETEQGYFEDYLEALQALGCVCLVLPLPFQNSDLLSKLQLLALRGGSR